MGLGKAGHVAAKCGDDNGDLCHDCGDRRNWDGCGKPLDGEQAMEEIYKQNLLRWPHKDRPTVDSLETRVSALEADNEQLRQTLSKIVVLIETWIGD